MSICLTVLACVRRIMLIKRRCCIHNYKHWIEVISLFFLFKLNFLHSMKLTNFCSLRQYLNTIGCFLSCLQFLAFVQWSILYVYQAFVFSFLFVLLAVWLIIKYCWPLSYSYKLKSSLMYLSLYSKVFLFRCIILMHFECNFLPCFKSMNISSKWVSF